VHGIHPPILTDRGLPAALESLAARSSVPVTVDAALGGRLELHSPPGRGTTVRAVMPVVPGDQTAGAGSGRPGVAASSALRA
jgi:signal transduction histidine kinase